jgi:hypothetical protein
VYLFQVTPSLSGAALNPNADVFESKQSEGGIDVPSSWDTPDTEFTSLDGMYMCEISGSHGGEYEDGCLLGRCAV